MERGRDCGHGILGESGKIRWNPRIGFDINTLAHRWSSSPGLLLSRTDRDRHLNFTAVTRRPIQTPNATMNKKLLAFLLGSSASAEIIYATSYNDHAVTALNLNGSSLTVLGTKLDCGSEPTWLTLDKAKGILYCLNEGWGGAASITSYMTSASGLLSTLDVLPVLKSPVSATLFGKGNSKLAVAY